MKLNNKIKNKNKEIITIGADLFFDCCCCCCCCDWTLFFIEEEEDEDDDVEVDLFCCDCCFCCCCGWFCCASFFKRRDSRSFNPAEFIPFFSTINNLNWIKLN